ncbi:MAG TPA: Uma2 family endonuclease [Trueperaceae bacterium]|jgi:hypothetical protein
MRGARLPQVTVAAFLAASRAGALAEGPRAELVGGRVRPGRAPSPRETAVLAHLGAQLRGDAVLRAGGTAVHAAPLRLGPWDLLRADVAVFPAAGRRAGQPLGVGGSYDGAAALLVAEVVRGRETHEERAPLYAAGGVRELWLLDVPRGFTEVLRAPWRGVYRSRTLWYPGEGVRALALGVEVVPLPAP